MRRAIRIVLWVTAIAVAVATILGTGVGVVLWRHTTISRPMATEAAAEFARLHERFKGKTPLIEVRNPGPVMLDVRVNRPLTSAPRQRVGHFHVIVWDSRGGTHVRSSVPVWWMHFSGTAVLARLGVPMGGLSLTVADIERYGPGIVTDFTPPGGGRMLVWVQ